MMKQIVVCAAAALVLAIANAANPPELKEGLWSIHTLSIDNPGNKKSDGTYSLCRDHAYDQSVQAHAKSMKSCTTVNESFQGGKHTAELHCVVAGTVIVSKGTTTFQGDMSTHSETNATYTPPMNGLSETAMIMDQKYVGSCPAGALPGDRIGADGKVTHLGKH